MPSPASPSPESPLARPALRPGSGFAIPPRTLLLVEDSRLAAEAVRLLCRRMGIRLRRTESLAGAALHLRVYRPDIALIDLGLPDGSGLELIRALAQSEARPDRVVAISGDSGLAHAAHQAGADAFLTKPLSISDHLGALTGNAEAIDEFDLALLRDRNAGADPLALRDDLSMADELLDDPAQLPYAGQFLASVGRCLHDDSLSIAAEVAGKAGDRTLLSELIRRRIAASPLI